MSADTAAPDPDTWERFTSDVRRLLLGTVRATDDWYTAFCSAGTNLQHLREAGKLSRGLRAAITLHVIFHWNRIGLPATTQATLAQAAKEAIFGETPANTRPGPITFPHRRARMNTPGDARSSGGSAES